MAAFETLKKNLIPVLSVTVIVVALSGCEQPEDNKIASAQKCLDNATTAAEASGCVAIVDGIDSEKAARIRCSGTYLQRDFTSTKFKTVFEQLKAQNGNNPATNMISTLAFIGTSAVTTRTETQDADYVVGQCKASGSPGMTMISAITKISTTMGVLLGASTPGAQLDVDQLKNKFQDLASAANGNDVAAATEIGTAALSAQSAYCATSTAANQDICNSLNAAVESGGGDPLAVGKKLADLLK